MLVEQISKMVISKINSIPRENAPQQMPGMDYISLYRGALSEQGVADKYLMDLDVKPTEFKVKTIDNIEIVGNVYNVCDSKKYVVAMHGYSSSKESMIHMVWFLKELGYNFVVFDFRNHGSSQVSETTFGINEIHDLESILEYTHSTLGSTEIGLVGASMGAHTLNHFAALAEDKIEKYNIKFGISDSTYNDFDNLSIRLAKSMVPAPEAILIPVVESAKQIYSDDFGINLNNINVSRELLSTKKTFPILFIHSVKDEVTDWQDSEKIFEDRKKINKPSEDEIIIFPSGEHVRTMIAHSDTYVESVKKFIKAIEV